MCQAICYTGLANLFYRTIGTAFGIFDGWRRQQEERLPENVTPHWCLRDVCEFRILERLCVFWVAFLCGLWPDLALFLPLDVDLELLGGALVSASLHENCLFLAVWSLETSFCTLEWPYLWSIVHLVGIQSPFAALCLPPLQLSWCPRLLA